MVRQPFFMRGIGSDCEERSARVAGSLKMTALEVAEREIPCRKTILGGIGKLGAGSL